MNMYFKDNLSIKQKLSKNYINAIGWRSSKKYVLFESDDWGSIRMPSRGFYNLLVSKGYPVRNYYFDRCDALENDTDLSSLFEILASVKDKNGQHAIMTPLSVVANPDFEKIESSCFSNYYVEPTTETYKKYADTTNIKVITKQGINEGVWAPQFHCREHIQVSRYMKALQSGAELDRLCFSNRAILGFINDDIDYFPAFSLDCFDELKDLKNIIREGLYLFEKMYGYHAISFCPPCSIINSKLFKVFKDNGVMGLQAGQYFSPEENGTTKHYQYYWGHTNEDNQIFWRRNCTFEPARDHNIDWVDRCIKEIEIAFRWGKPACINSHRVSYIGSIFQQNRDDTLKQLSALLNGIIKKWPDVEFISSEQLYNIIKESKK